ncbi:MAG: NrfD/PsrC family molybdoenzyme membrane anchor subunit [Gaiellaceae bacterium]
MTADSYYGRPIVKEPVWKPAVAVYFFTGGIAGGSAVLHGLAKLLGNERLARSTLSIGTAAELISPALLISDLGRPERFLNMLRVFKVTSPMSVGSWILCCSGGAAATAAALDRLRLLGPLQDLAEGAWLLTGPPLATYTGALLANTAIPVWSEARDELPWLFGSSASAAAGAAATIVTPPASAGPARRAAIGGAIAELGLSHAMEKKLGFVGEVYKQGEAGKYGKLSKALTATGSVVLAVGGRRSRAAAVTGGALILAGGLALRWSVFKAGFQSARDPKYTVVPQKRRAATRRAESPPASAPG